MATSRRRYPILGPVKLGLFDATGRPLKPAYLSYRILEVDLRTSLRALRPVLRLVLRLVPACLRLVPACLRLVPDWNI